jgi:hypothetical protein
VELETGAGQITSATIGLSTSVVWPLGWPWAPSGKRWRTRAALSSSWRHRRYGSGHCGEKRSVYPCPNALFALPLAARRSGLQHAVERCRAPLAGAGQTPQERGGECLRGALRGRPWERQSGGSIANGGTGLNSPNLRAHDCLLHAMRTALDRTRSFIRTQRYTSHDLLGGTVGKPALSSPAL